MAGKLKPIYTMVAHELALGIELRDICEARGLKYESIQRVARGDIFQQELKRFQNEIEREMVESAATDPILRKLQGLSYRAVTTLGEELDNHDPEDGASATSRIAASRGILDRAGYSGKSESDKDVKVIIMLSEGKLDAVKKATDITAEVLEQVPDYVDGHIKKLAR